MKITTIKAFALCAMFGSNLAISQAIPNGGFENWVQVGPMESIVSWAGTPGVTKSTMAHSGSYAAQIQATTFTNPMTMTQDTLPGIANTGVQGTGPGTGVNGFAFAYRPDSLVGWYKYTPNGVDVPVFRVSLTKWNSTTSTSEIISNSMLMGSTQATYKRFSFPIDYLSTSIPDSANVELISSDSPPNNLILGSTLIVDDVSFVYNTPAGISAKSEIDNQFFIYPNPASDKLNVKLMTANQSTFSLKIMDASGRILIETSEITIQEAIDISQLSKGTYFIHVTDNEASTTSSQTFIVK